MSASDHLSELQFQVHRGLSDTEPISLAKNLGMHWTTEENIANELAEHYRTSRLDEHDQETTPEYRTIIHASVPISSVETNSATLRKYGVLPEETNKNPEKEVSVKKGAPVFVTGVTNRKSDPWLVNGQHNKNRKTRTRKRTYNPPREMKA